MTTSKNYLADAEIKELNRLTSILLDIFEDQAEIGRLVMMDDARAMLDSQLRQLGRVVLDHGGGVTTEAAKLHAEHEYGRWDAAPKAERHREADERIASLKAAEASLPKNKAKTHPSDAS